jgi:hypothetical protein
MNKQVYIIAILTLLVIGASYFLFDYRGNDSSNTSHRVFFNGFDQNLFDNKGVEEIPYADFVGVYSVKKERPSNSYGDDQIILYSGRCCNDYTDSKIETSICGFEESRINIYRNDRQIKLSIKCESGGVRNFNVFEYRGVYRLVEEETGEIWERTPYYSYEYEEGGKKRRLTIYESPDCSSKICGGMVKGVFEEKGINGDYKIVSIGTSDGNFEYGRIATTNSKYKGVINIGVGKKAIILPWEMLYMGVDLSGVFVIDITNLKLQKIASIQTNENNEGTCDKSVKSMRNSGAASLQPCALYTGEIFVDESNSSSGYYQVLLKRKGDYYDVATDVVKKVTPLIKYIFVGSEYAEEI